MDIVLLEIILWAGLLFFFWSLRENLGKIEEIIDDPARQQAPEALDSKPACGYAKPDQLLEPVAAYLGHTIYRYALSGGRRYQFESILPLAVSSAAPRTVASVPRQLHLAPGLLYLECPATA